jgi:hypothetical protein
MSLARLALPDLARKIKAEHSAATNAVERWVRHARTAGQFLTDAKQQLGHGKWLPWLRDHCGLSVRTAQGYMRLARLSPTEAQRVADMSLRQALQATATSKAKPPVILTATYQVLVMCQTESDQAALLDRFIREGFQCRALIS